MGKDHWSTLAYLETLAAETGGIVSPGHQMRTDRDRHPHLVGVSTPLRGQKYPTRLRGEEELEDHDDWDCLDDAVEAGFIENVGTEFNRMYSFTELGMNIMAQLRKHKAGGGVIRSFVPELDCEANIKVVNLTFKETKKEQL